MLEPSAKCGTVSQNRSKRAPTAEPCLPRLKETPARVPIFAHEDRATSPNEPRVSANYRLFLPKSQFSMDEALLLGPYTLAYTHSAHRLTSKPCKTSRKDTCEGTAQDRTAISWQAALECPT